MIEALNQWTDGRAPLVIATVTAIVAFALALVFRRTRPALARGPWGPRIGKYIGVVAQGWVLTVIVIVMLWCVALRTGNGDLAAALDGIGLNWRLPANDVAIWSIVMTSAIALVSYAVSVARRHLGGAPTAAGLDILPETLAETTVFSLLVAPTAGIGEEIVYRGFLLSQLWGFSGDGWLAAVLSSAVFGALHIYQGSWGIARTALIGLILAVGVVMTGSLLPSIVAHTLANMLSATVRKPLLSELQPAL